MHTLTGMHRIHTYAHKRKHAYTQTCGHNRPSHSPNQFHSQASHQAAMSSKYYHNACVIEYAANEWMTSSEDTET